MVGLNEDERGIPPHRIGGVEVYRLIPIIPEPAVADPEDTTQDYDFLKWEAEWGGTLPEYVAFRWLEHKGLVSYEDFQFQSSSMGGRQMLGGAVVDFDFPAYRLAWRIQGEKWHVGDPAKEASDELQKLALTMHGYTVIDVFAQDVLERTEWVLSNALAGIEVRGLHGNL